MKIEKKNIKHFIVLTLHEEIDVDKDEDDLRNEIQQLVNGGHKFIALKFTHVSYIYSGIIKIITKFFKEVKEKGGMLAILETNQALYDVMDIIGITRIMNIYRTEKEFEEAIDSQ
jgi:anti-anti-sigma factor